MKKLLSFLIAFSLFSITGHAQKLPNIQERSLRAPASVKIDGKRAEWDNLIQAKNKATSISYSISNDDEKLYLVVLAADLDIANKIINAGVTLTVNGSGKAKDEGGMSVTYPFLYKEDNRPHLPLLDYHKEVAVWNEQLNAKTKDIRITGIKGVKDTISIYNQEGIRAAALFGEDSVFTYELAIPLRYLGLSVRDPKPLVYSIKLNGAPNYTVPLNFTATRLNPDGTITPIPTPPREVLVANANQSEAFSHLRGYLKKISGWTDKWNLMTMYGPNAEMAKSLITPSYFTGEYTLAK